MGSLEGKAGRVDLPSEGELEEHPLPTLLARLWATRANAIIDLASGEVHRRIYVEAGCPSFMQSNAEGENVAGLLHERGRITTQDYARVGQILDRGTKTMQRALLDLRLVDESELARAYLVLAGHLLPAGFGMTRGRWRLALGDGFVSRVPRGRFTMPDAVLDGIKKGLPLSAVFEWFSGREDVALRRAADAEPWWPRVSSAFSDLGEVEDGVEFRSFVKAKPRPGALLGLYAASTLELLRFQAQSSEDFRMRSAVAAASEVTSPTLARALDQVSEVGMSLDLFQLLGATRETSPEALDLRYIERAIRWRPEHFSELDPRRARLSDLRRRLDVAYETLKDPRRREEYELFLERRAKGLTTDVQQIADAEELYRRAQPALRREDWAEASALLSRAVELDPEPQVRASLAWVETRAGAIPAEEALRTIRAALAEEPLLVDAWAYAARLSAELGRPEDARRHWQRVRELEPSHPSLKTAPRSG